MSSSTISAVIVCLAQLTYLPFVSESCATPYGEYIYGRNFQALDDPNYVLFEVSRVTLYTASGNFNSYCKMININDGTTSNVVPCNNSNIRSWSNGDIDSTSTQLLSGTDNLDGTVDITLRRNNANVGIAGIIHSLPQNSSLYFDQFTINSIHSTFVLLGEDAVVSIWPEAHVEIVKITFPSQTDNTYPSVTNIDATGEYWKNWDLYESLSEPNQIPVFEDANAILLRTSRCLSNSLLFNYYFTYDAIIGEIRGINMDTSTTIFTDYVDDIAQKVYDVYMKPWPVSIYVYNLTNLGSKIRFDLNFTYVTDAPSKSPTNNPTNIPTIISQSNSPSHFPSKTPLSIQLSTEEVQLPTEEVQLSTGYIAGLINNWVFIAIAIGIGLLLLCFIVVICFYCRHSNKLKQRIMTLENEKESGQFSRLSSNSPVTTHQNKTDNLDTAIVNIDMKNNAVNTGDTNPIFMNPGYKDKVELNNEYNINIINNNKLNYVKNTDIKLMDKDNENMYEGALPNQPNVKDIIHRVYNNSQFSNSSDIGNKNMDKNYDNKIEYSEHDNEDMYGDVGKPFVS
eukprot:364169_1